MKQAGIVVAGLLLLGCEDSGPVPFTGPELFGTGAASGSGGSGGKNTGGFGGSSGGSGGSGGHAGSGGGCLGGPGTPCDFKSDCCQVSTYGDTCVGDPINQCAGLCYSSSDCPSDCCVALQDESYGACVSVSGYTCMP